MFKPFIAASVLALTCIGAHAVSADLTVTATIGPDACRLTLGSGGNVDYGRMSAATVKGYPLWGSSYRELPTRSVPLEVSCSAPTMFAISVVDNRSASKVAGLADADVAYGLGMAGSRSIGFFKIQAVSMEMSLASGRRFPLRGGVAVDASNGWSELTASDIYLSQTRATAFVERAGNVVLMPMTRLTGNLQVMPRVSNIVTDNVTSEIRLDASTTLVLLYV